ncbi:MAG: voltage-gated potassium channel [Verrucomicrobiales bacterium]|jgi:voltage-gated potassium channel
MVLFLRKWFKRRERRDVKIVNALLLALILDLLFGVLFYLVERGAQPTLTMQDAIWWAMVTMTTVGYGDFYAQTFAGRFLVSYPCFILGIGIIGYLLGTVADGVMEGVNLKRRGLMKSKRQNHIIICNFPSMEKILQLTDELRHRGKDTPIVVVTDTLDVAPSEFVQREIQFVKGPPVSEEVLERANVREADSVLILARTPGDPTSDAESFATCSIIEQIDKDIGSNIKTVVELVSRKNARLMERAQPDSVIASEGISDLLLVQELLSPGSHHIFEQLITNQRGCEFHTIVTKLRDVRVVDAQIAILQHDSDIQLIGLLRNDEPLLNPSKSTLIEENDLLIVLSEKPGAFAAIEDEIIATLSN